MLEEHAEARPDFRFRKASHIRHQLDFDRVYSAKTAYNDGTLLVYVEMNGLGYPRIGLSIGRKVGNAVKRNRWKRVIREAFRLSQHEFVSEIMDKIPVERKEDFPPELLAGVDIVVIPRLEDRPTLSLIRKSLRYCVKRATAKRLNLPPAKRPK